MTQDNAMKKAREALKQIEASWEIRDSVVLPKFHEEELARNDSLAASSIIRAIK